MSAHEHDTTAQAAPDQDGPAPAPDAEEATAAAAPGDDDATGPAVDEPGDADGGAEDAELQARAAKAAEYLALAQRTQADFENYRKRMARDVRAAEARGMGRLAKELLPALDNLDRAIAAVEASDADSDHHLTQGIRLVQSELSAAFTRSGIEGYASKGERFDPVQHEAVAQHAAEGAEPGTILEVLQPGYRFGDTVLRPARVVVAG